MYGFEGTLHFKPLRLEALSFGCIDSSDFLNLASADQAAERAPGSDGKPKAEKREAPMYASVKYKNIPRKQAEEIFANASLVSSRIPISYRRQGALPRTESVSFFSFRSGVKEERCCF